MEGKGKHLFEWFFHFDSGIDFKIHKNIITTQCTDGINISMTVSSEKSICLAKEKGWISKAYGNKEKSQILKISSTSECPLSLRTIIRRI